MAKTTWANPSPQAPYRSVVLNDSPSAYWRLGDSGATAADISGNGLTGTLSGGITTAQPGLVQDGATSMSFNGTTGQILVLDNALLDPGLASFTVEAWMKTGPSLGSPTSLWLPLRKGNGNVGGAGWGIGEGNDPGQSGFRFSDGTTAVISRFVFDPGYRPIDTLGAWTHAVVVFDRGTQSIRVYVNGKRQSQELSIAGVGNVTSNQQLTIGAGAGGWFLNGNLEEVAYYGKVLTTAQVVAHYNAWQAAYRRAGNLYTDVIFVDSKVAPLLSPAPAPFSAGNPAGIVPQGWVQQIGNDGEVDTMAAITIGGQTTRQANIWQWIVPYDGWAAWPPDPQRGQPGHTAQGSGQAG